MWEIYKPKGERQQKTPLVSLSQTSMVLNKFAREKLLGTKKIELAFDKESDVIRIRPAENEFGIDLKKTKLFAKEFYNVFGIMQRGKFKATYNEKENALFVQL
jgi:hypothetical protein